MTQPTRPDLRTLIQRIQADIEYHLPGANARAAESILNTLAQASGGALHGIYGYADYLSRQLLPDTADDDWLARWATLLQVSRQPATVASGMVQVSGTGLVPVLTLLTNPETQQQYRLSVPMENVATDPVLQLEAVTPGVSGNVGADTILQFTTPVIGIQSDVRVIRMSGGAEQETVEAWRARVVKQLAERSRVGDDDDYSFWAESSHAGVSGAWVYPLGMGLGTVVIRCIGPAPYTIPDNTILSVVQREVDRKRNSGATVFVIAATPQVVNISISGVSDASLRAGIERELSSLFSVKQQQSAQLRESEIDAAIQRYTVDYTLISPTTDIRCDDKSVFVLGDITWLE